MEAAATPGLNGCSAIHDADADADAILSLVPVSIAGPGWLQLDRLPRACSAWSAALDRPDTHRPQSITRIAQGAADRPLTDSSRPLSSLSPVTALRLCRSGHPTPSCAVWRNGPCTVRAHNPHNELLLSAAAHPTDPPYPLISLPFLLLATHASFLQASSRISRSLTPRTSRRMARSSSAVRIGT